MKRIIHDTILDNMKKCFHFFGNVWSFIPNNQTSSMPPSSPHLQRKDIYFAIVSHVKNHEQP